MVVNIIQGVKSQITKAGKFQRHTCHFIIMKGSVSFIKASSYNFHAQNKYLVVVDEHLWPELNKKTLQGRRVNPKVTLICKQRQ